MDLLGGENIQRVAYLKHGDVAAELQEIGARPVESADGGPKYYISTFLKWAAGSPILLLSFYTSDAILHVDNVEARVFKANSSVTGPLGRTIWNIQAFFKTLFSLWKFRPTWILCSASNGPLFAGFLISRLFSTPVVHTIHGSVDEISLPRDRRLIIKFNHWIHRRASAVLCHGPYLRQQLLDIGVDPERLFRFDASYRTILKSAEAEIDISYRAMLEQKKCILYVGRIEASKGAFDLLEACIKLLIADPSLALLYVGDGSSQGELKKRVNLLKLKGQVLFTGHIPHSKLSPIVRHCRFLVMPTRRISGEGRPKAAIEAFVLGTPIIVPNYGSFNYLVEDGVNGLYYKPDDIQDLSSKIYSLLYDEILYKRLIKGAIKAGKRLLYPEVTFMEALEQGFICSFNLS